MENKKHYFINKFPKIELSYETNLHKKVHADLYLLIPEGIRAFAWFTYYKNNNVCVLLLLNKYNQIMRIEETVLSFDKSLSYGTILYGTYFNLNNKKYFCSHDIFYYKNRFIRNSNSESRLQFLKNLYLSELKQISYGKQFIIFGMPILSNNLKEINSIIPTLHYNVRGIICLKFNDIDHLGIFPYKNLKMSECIFKITAEEQCDLYNLYCYNPAKKCNEFYGHACIPDYKTSVMMNDLFRIIKENKNLDLLEESDSEDEFENINSDKFVYLHKSFYFKCIFMKKFSKWKPVECLKFNNKLCTRREISLLEK